jgi:hypothetical protein
MGMHDFPPRMTAIIPTYYVTETTQEVLSDGNILIHNYSRRNGVLVHEFDCIISSSNLIRTGSELTNLARDLSADGFCRVPGEKVH